VDWLSQRAQAAFSIQIAALADQFGFSYQRVAIRRQKTRWGSCSGRGTISLNVALLFQKPAVVRYLLCHELAHTRHMNHSPKFWNCVAECEPAYRFLDAQLNQGWRHVPLWLSRRALDQSQ
jgi:predicted metal-dependent hydrolase